MFIRDKETKVIINTDDSLYREILAKRETEKVTSQLNDVMQEFTELKTLLAEVLNGKTSS